MAEPVDTRKQDRAEFAEEYARLEKAEAEADAKSSEDSTLLAKAGSLIKSMTNKPKPYSGPSTATIGTRG